jgi:putative oxidoreductase
MENILTLFNNGLGVPEYAQFVLRVGTGSFFAISGYHKLFNKQRHESLVGTLEACGVSCIKVMQWFVPSVEFFGGAAVTVGFLAPLAAVGLMVICLVATCTDGLKRIKSWQPIDKADYVDDIEYLPEVIYMLMLTLLIAGGPGAFAISSLFI